MRLHPPPPPLSALYALEIVRTGLQDGASFISNLTTSSLCRRFRSLAAGAMTPRVTFLFELELCPQKISIHLFSLSSVFRPATLVGTLPPKPFCILVAAVTDPPTKRSNRKSPAVPSWSQKPWELVDMQGVEVPAKLLNFFSFFLIFFLFPAAFYITWPFFLSV